MVGNSATDGALRRDAQRNRDLLVRAARELTTSQGVEVSYEAIAARAGTGVGTVYRRFPDREELLNELFAEHIEQVIALAREAAREPDAWTGLCNFLREQLEIEAGSRGLSELMRGGPRHAAVIAHAHAVMTPLIANLVARAVAGGQLPDGIGAADVATAYLMVGTVLDSCRAIEADDVLSDTSLWRRSLRIALAGLQHVELSEATRPDETLVKALFRSKTSPTHRSQ